MRFRHKLLPYGTILLASIHLLTACRRTDSASAAATGKVVVVFIDRSQSTREDRGLYARALAVIMGSLKEGDRFVLGAITDASSKDFVKYVDRTLPLQLPQETVWDNELDYRKRVSERKLELEKFTAQLHADVDLMLTSPSDASRSLIFETLIIANQIFAAEKRKKILVILSDMLEDSPEADFEHATIDEAFINTQIQRQKQVGILPSFQGVNVYVVGAHANTPERAASVQRFWEHYFEATGAPLGHGRYSRMLFGFAE